MQGLAYQASLLFLRLLASRLGCRNQCLQLLLLVLQIFDHGSQLGFREVAPCVCVCACVCTDVCAYADMYTYHTHMYMGTCVYVCVCVCVYVYTSTRSGA